MKKIEIFHRNLVKNLLQTHRNRPILTRRHAVYVRQAERCEERRAISVWRACSSTRTLIVLGIGIAAALCEKL